jgi:hypothetical protein
MLLLDLKTKLSTEPKSSLTPCERTHLPEIPESKTVVIMPIFDNLGKKKIKAKVKMQTQ